MLLIKNALIINENRSHQGLVVVEGKKNLEMLIS